VVGWGGLAAWVDASGAELCWQAASQHTMLSVSTIRQRLRIRKSGMDKRLDMAASEISNGTGGQAGL
jgi:hypothetical protein